MNKLNDRPPMSHTDKLCLVALAGCFLAPHLAVWAMDAAAYRAAEADKPPSITITAPPIDCTPLVEAVEARRYLRFVSPLFIHTPKKRTPLSNGKKPDNRGGRRTNVSREPDGRKIGRASCRERV